MDKINYKPHPKQKEFFERKTDVLWVGGQPNRAANIELMKLISLLQKEKQKDNK